MNAFVSYCHTRTARCAWATVAAICSVIASPAIGGTYDGAMGKTKYVLMTGDLNGDGQNDVLLMAPRKVMMLPLDDMMLPILLATPSPTFLLLSTSFGNYTLIVKPDAALMFDPIWQKGAQTLTFSGPNGTFADSMTIQAAANYQASFVVTMNTAGQLELRSTTPPAVNPGVPPTTPPAGNPGVPPATPPATPLPVCP